MKIVYSKITSETDDEKPTSDCKHRADKSATDNYQVLAPVKVKVAKPKSLYTIAREEKFRKAALKKLAPRIKEIQKYFPDWNLT